MYSYVHEFMDDNDDRLVLFQSTRWLYTHRIDVEMNPGRAVEAASNQSMASTSGDRGPRKANKSSGVTRSSVASDGLTYESELMNGNMPDGLERPPVTSDVTSKGVRVWRRVSLASRGGVRVWNARVLRLRAPSGGSVLMAALTLVFIEGCVIVEGGDNDMKAGDVRYAIMASGPNGAADAASSDIKPQHNDRRALQRGGKGDENKDRMREDRFGRGLWVPIARPSQFIFEVVLDRHPASTAISAQWLAAR
ncbi:hypothetical protein OG21DRAFT_1525115 [Imleria badia]|nr:hypothetical protein OG21DRAFT_1525115 [Imleria badia]